MLVEGIASIIVERATNTRNSCTRKYHHIVMLMLRRIITIARVKSSCSIHEETFGHLMMWVCRRRCSSSCSVVVVNGWIFPFKWMQTVAIVAHKIGENSITSIRFFFCSCCRCHLFRIDDRSHTNVSGQRNCWWAKSGAERRERERNKTSSTSMDPKIYKRIELYMYIKKWSTRITQHWVRSVFGFLCSSISVQKPDTHTHTAKHKHSNSRHNFTTQHRIRTRK